MALIVSPTNFLQADSRSSRLRLASDLENSESIPQSEFQKWQNEEGLENRLENLALAKAPKRNSGKIRDSFSKDFATEGFDHRYPDPPLSDLAVPLKVSDWDSSVAIYKTAPSQGHCDSAGSSGVSRQSDKSGRRNRQGYGTGYGDFPPGGRGGPGGDDGEPPSLPQPIEPPACDGKKYYACWFWLYDPVTYHSCGDIRKEAHHLKHVHLPKHFPNGLPSALKHRMNYDAVWYVLFPGHELPDIKDRDERLLDMARQYHPVTTTTQPSVTTAIVSRRDSALLSPDTARYRSGAGESGQRPSSGSVSVYQSQFRTRRHSVHNRPTSSRFGSSSTGGRSTRDSSSNGAGSWYDPNYDYITPSQNTIQNHNEECNLIPDGDSIANPLAMYLEYDGRAVMSSTDYMEIDNMTRSTSDFYPRNPRIRVIDSYLNEAYFWDERHLGTEFDFKNHYLIHFSDRTTGADMLLSIHSMDVLQREYYFNMKPRASSDGFAFKLICLIWTLKMNTYPFDTPPYHRTYLHSLKLGTLGQAQGCSKYRFAGRSDTYRCPVSRTRSRLCSPVWTG
ncbi:uncharacterized protein DFL_003865 [Arthrobotrys flagrans]|uniref:Uncharacterized protein n=1 Tax=Arthrobotrys flagrans TaxID=97331 RepID=A0A437A323_ARTFL|nr:hypothetical protein DFL_003865 [Arthrobotrys flagrans]